MQLYCNALTRYSRLKTLEVKVGDLLLGSDHPIRVQTMTTTDTMDTLATVEQSIRCIEAGAELVRITAPSKKEAENLLNIRNELHRRGYHTPLVADIHYTPNAAEIAARIGGQAPATGKRRGPPNHQEARHAVPHRRLHESVQGASLPLHVPRALEAAQEATARRSRRLEIAPVLILA